MIKRLAAARERGEWLDPGGGGMSKPRFATVWLGGCSGCHMSFLDMDEWLFELAELVDVVYSPIADVKVFPEDVDITLVEGAVANEDNVELAHIVRRQLRSWWLPSATAPCPAT